MLVHMCMCVRETGAGELSDRRLGGRRTGTCVCVYVRRGLNLLSLTSHPISCRSSRRTLRAGELRDKRLVERQVIGGERLGRERLPSKGWTMGASVFACVVVAVCLHVGQSGSRCECMRVLIGERMHACTR